MRKLLFLGVLLLSLLGFSTKSSSGIQAVSEETATVDMYSCAPGIYQVCISYQEGIFNYTGAWITPSGVPSGDPVMDWCICINYGESQCGTEDTWDWGSTAAGYQIKSPEGNIYLHACDIAVEE